MTQSLVFALLMLALVLPMLGALALRVLASRLTPVQLYGAAALLFGVALVSVFALARSNVSSLQVGRLTVLLPVSAPDEEELQLAPPTIMPAPGDQFPTGVVSPTATTIATAAPLGTAAPTATSEPTAAPTTAVPTAVPPTEIPPTAVPTPVPPAPRGPRRYVVQPGDTLRGIAEQFNVSVQALLDANDMTPEEADALRIGQELVIP